MIVVPCWLPKYFQNHSKSDSKHVPNNQSTKTLKNWIVLSIVFWMRLLLEAVAKNGHISVRWFLNELKVLDKRYGVLDVDFPKSWG